MEIELNLDKSIEENASLYFEKSKKSKKKIEGAKEALKKTQKTYQELKEKGKEIKKKEKNSKSEKSKKEWFEKYRWFYSSEGFLVIGGRDATTNEIIIKKNTEKDDLVFHTDIQGSPFVVIKSNKKKISKKTIEEAAIFTASFSKAWKLGLTFADVYYIEPEQVSKKAQAGEYLKKGAFMIYGKKNYLSPKISVAIGLYKGKIMSGPVSAIKKQCEEYFEIEQGDDKPSDVAKALNKTFKSELDDIIRALPPGGCKIKK
jgi:predicted ribosome quality control (RQC) complex YloA/Tae2 family protein